MNEAEENRLEHSKTPEPALRLRKGHQLDGASSGDSDVRPGGRGPLVEASVLSSYHRKVSESERMVSKNRLMRMCLEEEC